MHRLYNFISYEIFDIFIIRNYIYIVIFVQSLYKNNKQWHTIISVLTNGAAKEEVNQP